jgi:cobalt/nickel transport protein
MSMRNHLSNIKPYKKYLIFLGILAILSPIGIILPEYFKAGEAWGEWSTETVQQETGLELSGMQKDAAMYKAPIPDYNLEKEDDSLSRLSLNYIMSAFAGIAIILLITFGITKLVSGKKSQ